VNVRHRAQRLKLLVLAAAAVMILAMWALAALSINNARRTAFDHARTEATNLSGDEDVIVRESAVDHVKRIIGNRRVPGYPHIVGSGLDLDQELAKANADAKILLGLVGLATLLLAWLVIYLMRGINRRMAREIARDAVNIDLRESKELVQQTKDLLTDAVDCISEPFTIYDKDDRLVLCNEAFRQLFPHPDHPIIYGMSFEELLRDSMAQGIFKGAIDNEDQWIAERNRVHRQARGSVEVALSDGRHLLATNRRMKSGGIAGLRTDVTDLVQTKEALQKALAKAEAANNAKTLFLANMSHELRTPLNAILGFSQMIRDQMRGPVNPPVYADYAKDINSAGNHLLEIINNVLDISRIEVGKFDLKEEPVEIDELVQSAMLAVRVQAGKKMLALNLRLPKEPVTVRADRQSLRQILINLLINAVKFTPNGGRVMISFEATPTAAIFAVADTGIGMSPEEIAVATEPFHQIGNTLVKDYEGLGLGLSLAKQMTELHGGTLEIESEKGAGTTVRVVLPAERVLHAPGTSAAA